MRTNIEIDDGLIAEAMARGGHPTKKAAVEEGLRLLVRLARQREAVEALWGSIPDWQAPPTDQPLSPQQDWALHEDQAPLRGGDQAPLRGGDQAPLHGGDRARLR
ncbi:type II toxin-antitoxin system VapB family antitoxin [Dankookia sp. P2]|uniref:type II toxin-antitoxin system VapB family antitoxin n=1 Tax=Dankookia sp. P2 TaxID=3423955 RepID=UPI003D671B62